MYLVRGLHFLAKKTGGIFHSVAANFRPQHNLGSSVRPTQEMSPHRIIHDCDAGTDDAQALLIALAQPNVQVLAVTCVFGNTALDNSSFNVLRVLKQAGRLDIPVYRGCDTSLLGHPCIGDNFHGFDGLGDTPDSDPPDINLIKKEHAANVMVKLANEYPGEISLVATGPVTNLAVALKLDPELGQKLKQCVIMGGSTTGRGNNTACAEFNFASDPDAAEMVLRLLKCPITVVDLEICAQSQLSMEWYDKFVDQPTPLAAFIKRAEKYMIDQHYRPRPGRCYEAIWDQFAMVVALDPRIAIETKDVWATVDCQGKHTRGYFVVEHRKKHIKEANIKLITKMDRNLFEKYLYQGIGVQI